MRDGEERVQPARVQVDRADMAEDDFTVASLDSPGVAARSLLGSLPRWLRGRRTHKARVVGLVATALLVMVVAVSLFASATRDPSGAVATLLQLATPSPTATFVPGANAIYFSNGAPWGTLTIDGKRLPQADLTGYGVSVTHGQHHLVYQARYFPTLRCVFSAPRAPGDTCPLDTSYATTQFLLTKALARAIDLGSTGATLQADQRAALTRLANDLLKQQSYTAAIAPGDRYEDGQGHVTIAGAPLQVQLDLTLDTSGANIDGGVGGAPCAQFCPEPTFYNGMAPPGGGWAMGVNIATSWAIADAGGHVLATLNDQAQQRYPGAFNTEVGMQLTPAGWKITGLEGTAIQLIENVAMNQVFQAESDSAGGGAGFSFNLESNPLNGCVMDVIYGGATSRLLWRFGALVAVDANAHRVFPKLPVATAQEQATVAQIMAQSQLRDDSILPVA